MIFKPLAAAVAVSLSIACMTTKPSVAATAAVAPTTSVGLTVQGIPLPGGSADGVGMDYIAYDPAHRRVWVPAGNTARVDVVDATSGQVSEVAGFPTAEIERNGHKRTVGPSSAAVGEGVVYVGNRGDSSVCAVDAATLHKGACLKLQAMPDGLAYVRSAKELWVTTPRAKAIVVLDASQPGKLAPKATVLLEGEPEGFAVDDSRGLFYTNLEDKDRTLTLDVAGHRVLHTWASGCGEDGPKGLSLDHKLNYLFVACSGGVRVFDAGHGGKVLSSLDTGEGVDNIDYLENRRELFAGAGKAAKLTVARVDDQGVLTVSASVPTAVGARNAVATEDGSAYLTNSRESKLLLVKH